MKEKKIKRKARRITKELLYIRWPFFYFALRQKFLKNSLDALPPLSILGFLVLPHLGPPPFIGFLKFNLGYLFSSHNSLTDIGDHLHSPIGFIFICFVKAVQAFFHCSRGVLHHQKGLPPCSCFPPSHLSLIHI